MLLFPDIYVFEGLTTFPRENATFRNGTLRIFPKYSRKFQILCEKAQNADFLETGRSKKKVFTFFCYKNLFAFISSEKWQLKVPFLTVKVYFPLPKKTSF